MKQYTNKDAIKLSNKATKQQKENEMFDGSKKQYQYNTDFRSFLR